jgi:formylmethanofuran dehydrogenase subunit C
MIRLTLRSPPPRRLSLDGIAPEKLAALSEGEIARLPLGAERHAGTIGDWFVIDRSTASDDRLVLAADCDRLDEVGGGMRRGEIVVEGSVGAYAGLGMTGGSLVIAGSAGHGAATAMHGGMLRIHGDVGDALGGALPGEGFGMREGVVIVGGSAASGAGDRMRRGLIVIAGAAGPFCGARLWAGTIVVGGRIGDHCGIAMRRGSLFALGGAARISPSFADCGAHELSFARLLARMLAGYGLKEIAERFGRLRRWAGDLAVGGKGEILAPP